MDTEFRKHSNQGFTMAELLIVVAIIAVLVAIAIPVFASQLEKSREAVDLANTRSAYAALQISKIEGTLPDGSLPTGDSLNDNAFFVYTESGFERSSNSMTSAPIELKSSGDGSILSAFVRKASEIGNFDDPTSVKGCVLVAYRNEIMAEYVLLIFPNWWTGD